MPSSMPSAPAPEVVRVVETQIVEVPVAVSRRPPDELLAAFRPTPSTLPLFIPIDAPGASSCLSPEGERKLVELLIRLRARDNAWRTWAQEEER